MLRKPKSKERQQKKLCQGVHLKRGNEIVGAFIDNLKNEKKGNYGLN